MHSIAFKTARDICHPNSKEYWCIHFLPRENSLNDQCSKRWTVPSQHTYWHCQHLFQSWDKLWRVDLHQLPADGVRTETSLQHLYKCCKAIPSFFRNCLFKCWHLSLVISRERCQLRRSWTQRPDFTRPTDVLQQTKLELLTVPVTDVRAWVHSETISSLPKAFTNNKKQVSSVVSQTGTQVAASQTRVTSQHHVKFSTWLKSQKMIKICKFCFKNLKFLKIVEFSKKWHLI